jgi:hypothetical protein
MKNKRQATDFIRRQKGFVEICQERWQAKTITDTGHTAYQFQLQGDSFVSSSPIPLSENVLKR